MSSITAIQSRLKALEDAIVSVAIPSEQEFWEMWGEFDELSKAIYEAVATNRIWETETDPQTRKYFEAVSKYLINAGIAQEGQSILDIAAELEARNAV